MLDILRLQPVAALHLTPPLHSWSNMHHQCAAVITASIEIINQCRELGILWSISGPAATKLWPPALMQTVLAAGAHQTLLDLCMFGAGWTSPVMAHCVLWVFRVPPITLMALASKPMSACRLSSVLPL